MLIDTASPRSRESVCPLHAVGAVMLPQWDRPDRIMLVSGWRPPLGFVVRSAAAVGGVG